MLNVINYLSEIFKNLNKIILNLNNTQQIL